MNKSVSKVSVLLSLKRFMTFVTTLALISLMSPNAHAAYTLDKVQELLSNPKVVEADFNQERTLPNVKKPLKSSGVMLMARDKGLVWDQQKPFKMTMLINDERMVQKIGKNTTEVTKDSNPQFFEFSSVLRALMLADRKVLEQNFDIKFKDNNKSWNLVLVPKIAPLNKIFKSIDIKGDEVVNDVTLLDTQKGKTHITFSDHVLRNELSDEDIKILELKE